MTAPASIPYAVLSQRHPSYDAKLYARIEDLYVGGWRIQQKSTEYLPRLAFEHDKPYDARCSTASYQPYFGQIVDQLVADLFTQPLTIAPAGDAEDPDTPGTLPDPDFYAELADNVDRCGTPMVDLMRCTLRTALKHRCGYVAVDAPAPTDAKVQSLAEEDAAGLRRVYAYEIPAEQVVDWELDDDGQYVWIVLCSSETPRTSPDAKRSDKVETFTVWTTDGKAARWSQYRIAHKDGQKPDDNAPVQRVVDETSTSFARIPILPLRLPEGLWVGNKIGPQALEHWRRRSSLIGAEARSMVAIPVVGLGPEMPPLGQMNSEAQQDPDRGDDPADQFSQRGYLRLGSGDQLYFAEPEGKAYEIVHQQLDALKDEIFRVNHLMAASVTNKPSSLGRSGLSKQKDGEATAKVLGALGQKVREFALRLYGTISGARKEAVIWSAHGLDSYEVDDRQEVLDEALQAAALNIPSATWRKEHSYRLAQKLVPGLSPDTMAVIRKEIVAGIDEEQTIRDAANDAKLDQLKNPKPPANDGGDQQQQDQAAQ